MRDLENSCLEVFRIRYSYYRIQWLLLATSGLIIMTLSAQELWGTNISGLLYNVNMPLFGIYFVVLTSIIFIANYLDCRKITSNVLVIFLNSIASLIVDLGFLSFVEFFVLATINQLSIDMLKSVTTILLVVLPWSLGAVSLSMLTMDYLRKRAEKLHKELRELKKEVDSLDKDRQEKEKQLIEFEKKKKEFYDFFKDRNKSEENE